MALFDSLSRGADFIDQLQRGKITDAQARYAEPMERNRLYALQTQNKYLDPQLAASLYALQTQNKYLPDKLRLENQHQGLANIHQGQENQIFMPEHQTDLEYKRHQNNWYDREAQSRIDAQKSLGEYRSAGGAGQRFAPADIKRLNAFDYELKRANPTWDDETLRKASDAYLSGNKEIEVPITRQGLGGAPQIIPNKMNLPELGGRAQQLLTQIHKSNSTAAIQNQAASLANTSNELSGIDISPAMKFAGIKGKADYLYQKANPSARTEAWRDYDAFRNVDAVMVMDTLRKSLGTSVVPGYVYETIGKFSNPNDEMWDDPAQVEKKWKTLTGWVEKNASNVKKQADRGATVGLDTNKKEKYSKSELDKMAQEAIMQGADPREVEKRMQELANA